MERSQQEIAQGFAGTPGGKPWGRFNDFCSAMLLHEVGRKAPDAASESSRSTWLNPTNIESDIFHSDLYELQALLAAMAAYISIPWHLYAADKYELDPNHAHIAFRRLIIGTLLSKENALLDIELDTAPRTVDVPDDFAAALAAADARARFDALAPSHRKAHVTAIESAKAPATRGRRIAAAVAKIRGDS